MPSLDVRLYAAFAAAPSGGNVAGVVYDPIGLAPSAMQRVAADLGAPTTAFVRELGGATRTRSSSGFALRFFSRVAEMPACGHATVAALVALADDGRAAAGEHRVRTAAGDLEVTLERDGAGVQVTVRQPAPRFDLFDLAAPRIAPLLGLAPAELKAIGSAATGLRHLFVEVERTGPLGRLRPDDAALRALCAGAGIDTVGVYARLERGRAGADVRLRDLCHGVGDPEEAASGTTNGALASLLWRRGLLASDGAGGRVVVRAEQGVEMGRPSLVTTELRVAGDRILAVRVGGSATRRLEGRVLA
jgi:trans-2,3-dihydro-3-hydroxyanthranilate isomerase